MKLHPYQKDHVRRLLYALRRDQNVLDASDTGTGKTVTSAVLARLLECPVFVVCPKAVIPSWERHLKEWAPGRPFGVINYEKLRTGNTGFAGQTVRHYKHKGKEKKKITFDYRLVENTLFIFDEVHKCKGRNTLNAQLLKDAVNAGYRILALSATAAQSPLDLEALGLALGLHRGTNFYPWMMKRGVYKHPLGYLEFPTGTHRAGTKAAKRVERAKAGLQSIHEDIFRGGRGSRMRIALIPEFPKCLNIADSYCFDAKEARAKFFEYFEFFDKVCDEEYERMLETTGEANMLVEQLRARQESELFKLPGLIELAEDEVATGRSVVIFTQFRLTAEALHQHIEKSGLIIGEQDAKIRQAYIDRFRDDKIRVLVSTVDAGGTGVDLHDVNGNYPRTSLLCPTYNAVNYRQAMGRIHRAGSKSPAINKLVFAAGTIEEKVRENVEKKLDRMDLLNDGDLAY